MNLPSQHQNRISAPLQLGRRLGRSKSAHCYGKELGGKARLLGALAVRSLRTVGRLDWADLYRGVGDLPTQSFRFGEKGLGRSLEATSVQLIRPASGARARARDGYRDGSLEFEAGQHLRHRSHGDLPVAPNHTRNHSGEERTR